ncbi:hypothetical protein AMAG_17681 [Allomyces macrogynus ATCC 38327]|uniref:EF-hand domain-containing protein n=1 Tax=Allomyces macrogynus (strain ATCC 38327) TaxID=578462 RepID=A0A0L0RVV7_ALLM3|nr:hypothetical protein AMAG_17681 [Allomyces macrogynus ATCC 38327]|eukprot:KNE54527.1 hypothetical protein AMAG_17681 [Allomyces macrogynus ATCC 38327]
MMRMIRHVIAAATLAVMVLVAVFSISSPQLALAAASANQAGAPVKSHSNYFPASVKEQFLEQLKKNSQLGHIDKNDEEFYFFSLHDLNADEHLDGNELRAAFAEYTFDQAKTMNEIEAMVDHILAEDDADNDGRISWEEYLASESIHDAAAANP